MPFTWPKPLIKSAAALAAAGVLAAGGTLYAARAPQTLQPPQTPLAVVDTTPRAVAASPAVRSLDGLSDAFAEVAARIRPSVVYITAKQMAVAAADRGTLQRKGIDPRDLPPEFRRFFQLPDGEDGPAPRGGMSSGSGFVISADGYVLTNAHVVDGASEVTVRLLDRRQFRAKVVGKDLNTDVAVLKIDATGLTPAPLGDSDAARVGEWVLAVGNPLGAELTFTVTSGIISAKGRTLDLPGRSASSIQDFIQTDAAINPGNSGGPLVNTHGQVIGINSAIASPTGTYAGYGFAVPINLAHAVADQLIAHGSVQRAALGVTVRDATAEDAAYVGLPDIRGVVVQDFAGERSAARDAGVEAGDVIVAVDGKPVDYVSQLQERIAFRRPGERAAIEVARKGGRRVTVQVPLQSVAGEPALAVSKDAGDDDAATPGAAVRGLGVSVQPLDGETARQLRLPSDVRGVLVTGVSDDGAAAGRLADPNAGGPDVIVSVEGTAVPTVADLRAALGRSKAGDVVTLRVYNVPARSYRIERVRIG